MCGRFAIDRSLQQLADYYRIAVLSPSTGRTILPRWNIAPTQPVPVVTRRDGELGLELMRWGLVPSWGGERIMATGLINARAETVAEKPSFRAAFKSRRCIVPASGFYEWKTAGRAKTPHYIRRRDRELLSMAGLWETRIEPDGETLRTFAIITCQPNSLMADLHDRMPVILPQSGQDAWLAEDAAPAELLGLLAPYPAGLMEAYPVGSAVGNIRNEGPGLVRPFEDTLF